MPKRSSSEKLQDLIVTSHSPPHTLLSQSSETCQHSVRYERASRYKRERLGVGGLVAMLNRFLFDHKASLILVIVPSVGSRCSMARAEALSHDDIAFSCSVRSFKDLAASSSFSVPERFRISSWLEYCSLRLRREISHNGAKTRGRRDESRTHRRAYKIVPSMEKVDSSSAWGTTEGLLSST